MLVYKDYFTISRDKMDKQNFACGVARRSAKQFLMCHIPSLYTTSEFVSDIFFSPLELRIYRLRGPTPFLSRNLALASCVMMTKSGHEKTATFDRCFFSVTVAVVSQLQIYLPHLLVVIQFILYSSPNYSLFWFDTFKRLAVFLIKIFHNAYLAQYS